MGTQIRRDFCPWSDRKKIASIMAISSSNELSKILKTKFKLYHISIIGTQFEFHMELILCT